MQKRLVITGSWLGNEVVFPKILAFVKQTKEKSFSFSVICLNEMPRALEIG